MHKVNYKIFRLYHEDVFGQLIFNSKFTYTFRDLTSIFYDRHLKRKDLSRKGISFTSKFKRPKKFNKRKTHVGQRMLDKQKFKIFYGNLRNYQLRQIYYKAIKMQGIFALNFLRLLESRLDIILYRSNFGLTYKIIRQYIIYNKVLVNDKVINKPSNLIKIGDKITIIDNIKYYIIQNIKLFYKKLNINEIFSLKPNININFKRNIKYRQNIKLLRISKNNLFAFKKKNKIFIKNLEEKLKKKYKQQQIFIKNYKIILSLYYKLKTYTYIIKKILRLKRKVRYLNFFIIHLYYFLQFLFSQSSVNYKYTIQYVTLLRRFIYMKLEAKKEVYNILNCTNIDEKLKILLYRKTIINHKLKTLIKQFLLIKLFKNYIYISKHISFFNKYTNKYIKRRNVFRNKMKYRFRMKFKLQILSIKNSRLERKIYKYRKSIYKSINLFKKLKNFKHKIKMREIKIKHNIEKNLKKIRNKRLFAWKRRIKYEKYYKLSKQKNILKKRNSKGLKKNHFFLKKFIKTKKKKT